MCVVGTITGFGVLLIVAKTIAQALTSPQLVDDSEHSPGLTVSSTIYLIQQSHSASYLCLLLLQGVNGVGMS